MPRKKLKRPATLQEAAERYYCTVKFLRAKISDGTITGYRLGKREGRGDSTHSCPCARGQIISTRADGNEETKARHRSCGISCSRPRA